MTHDNTNENVYKSNVYVEEGGGYFLMALWYAIDVMVWLRTSVTMYRSA